MGTALAACASTLALLQALPRDYRAQRMNEWGKLALILLIISIVGVYAARYASLPFVVPGDKSGSVIRLILGIVMIVGFIALLGSRLGVREVRSAREWILGRWLHR